MTEHCWWMISVSGQPMDVSVMRTWTWPGSGLVDLVHEAEVDDVVADLGVDHGLQRRP
jgi:hypothetical protein